MDPVGAFRQKVAPDRSSGIRIDKQGQFWHEGQAVTHAGFRRALSSWLDRLPPPDGRYILRIDETRYAFVDVDDTPLVVVTLRLHEREPWIVASLCDGSEEPLDAQTLSYDEAGTLRVWVRDAKLEARLATAAVAAIEPFLQQAEQGWQLTLPGQPSITLRPRQ